MIKKPTEDELREELSNLEDDLAVIESGEMFSIGSTGDQEPVDQQAINVIKRRIAEIKAKLAGDE
ncbi:hypothetical protein N8E89_24350 (plasmid) [Phyllobacterium sp. A18/5-2]|uniref:hypothetical protein n=1 Tax=Phyllobacterium sp. A18/5-2 TaxID=2978392 RepID=UPI0021C8D19D|nr:hypothetical protein [Phyllobacterium sp. A18/5-2]UXN66301.1 hypothetical protein N8E89_24350 [Phyllobacterium sp. A18/5-2]